MRSRWCYVVALAMILLALVIAALAVNGEPYELRVELRVDRPGPYRNVSATRDGDAWRVTKWPSEDAEGGGSAHAAP
jgi:hypothetical protein